MAGNPFYQNLDPYSPPDPVTPADTPGDPAGYAMVTPHGRGPAPYDILDGTDQFQADIETALSAAQDVSGAGVMYPQGERQRQTEALLNSPQGFNSGGGLSGYDITAGWSGEPDESWDNNPQAATILDTPIQGEPGFPLDYTMKPGLQKYGTS